VSGASRSPRLPRREILIIAGLAVVAFVITLSVLASQTAADTRSRATAALQELQKAQKAPPLTSEELALAPEDFLLPSTAVEPRVQGYVPWRPRTSRWTKEMVDAYWVPPRQVAAEIVATINDQAMERLFEKVP